MSGQTRQTARNGARLVPMAACVLLAGCGGAPGSDDGRPADLVLENARVVDPAARRIRAGHIVIGDGVIRGIADTPPRNAAARLDVDGAWVIPGLVDMHTHSGANVAPPRVIEFAGTAEMSRRMLYMGVTAFLDLFSLEDSIFALRERRRGVPALAAELFAAGPCLTATGGHCTEYGIPTRVVDSPADARAEVAELATRRPDVVKLVYDHSGYLPTMSRETMAAVIAAARELGPPTVVHVATWSDVEESVAAGVSVVTHLPREGPIPSGLARRIAEAGTWYMPTMVTPADAVVLARQPALLDDPALEAVTSPAIRDAYRDSTAFPPYLQGWLSAADSIVSGYYTSLRALHDAGVPLLLGTDAGNYGAFLGWSVHRELERYVEAGLSPWDALEAATTAPGRFLRRPWGVEPGDEANLVVLDGSPIEDIRNTRRIRAVILRGEVVDRDSLLHEKGPGPTRIPERGPASPP